MRLILPIAFMLMATGLVAQIIPSSRIISFVPGSTVGVFGGIPYYTNVVNVLQPPYNADNTGATSAEAAIQSALDNVPDYSVVFCPRGVYDLTAANPVNGQPGPVVRRNNVVLRGEGTNTIFVGGLTVGFSPNFAIGAYTGGFPVFSGATLGSTNINLTTNQDGLGTAWAPGNTLMFSSHVQSSDRTNWAVMSARSEDFAFSTNTGFAAPITDFESVVTVANGTNLTVWPPLCWNFTNTPIVAPYGQLGVFLDNTFSNIGLESFTIISTNGSLVANTFEQILFQGVRNSWATNVNSIYGVNHDIAVSTGCENCEINNCWIYGSRLAAGSNEGGLLLDHCTGCYFINNIIGGAAPGIEWNQGVDGCAFFGNFFTNNFANTADITMHNTHPINNLWEENVTADFLTDGYFGSSSDITLFRNRVRGTVALNRWTTYVNAVGNVIGNDNFGYIYEPTNSNFDSVLGKYGIFVIGFPNINNNTFNDTSGPEPYNFPGNFQSSFPFISNGLFTITSTQIAQTNINGNFTNVIWGIPDPYNYTIFGQDAVNTNKYWPIGTPVSATTTVGTFATAVTVSNGWRIYITGPLAYQWLQTSNITTDLITGNGVMTNQASYTTVWDANGVQSITNSILYPTGTPPGWNGNNFPAIGPDVFLSTIPAQLRYMGTGVTNPVSGLHMSLIF